MKPCLGVVTTLTLALAAAPAFAQGEDATATPTPTPTPTAPDRDRDPDPVRPRVFEAPLVLDLGARVSFLRSEGYDPFSSNDVFSQLSLGGAVEVLRAGRFAFAPGVRWDYGQRNGEARGAKSNFLGHRVSASLEGRIYATPWLYAFGRAAPGVAFERARLAEPSAAADLATSDWLPSVDVSFGAAAMTRGPFRFGGTVDFGYGFVSDLKMSLRPDLPAEDPRRTASVTMRDLNASGAFFRLGLALVF
jgi:hypothetical protein